MRKQLIEAGVVFAILSFVELLDSQGGLSKQPFMRISALKDVVGTL